MRFGLQLCARLCSEIIFADQLEVFWAERVRNDFVVELDINRFARDIDYLAGPSSIQSLTGGLFDSNFIAGLHGHPHPVLLFHCTRSLVMMSLLTAFTSLRTLSGTAWVYSFIVVPMSECRK